MGEPFVKNGTKVLQHIISQGRYSDEADLWEVSPVRLMDGPEADPALFLEHCYEPTDLLFIGGREEPGIIGKNIRQAAEWIAYFRNGGTTAPHICINPLTGQTAPKKSGDGVTYRGDANVKMFKYCLIEFDGIPRTDQLKFWSGVKMPVSALIDTGGKSIHGLIPVQHIAQVRDGGEWLTHIKANLYDRLLRPIGVDAACSNVARLSRLPGHFREEKRGWQRLLYLAGRYGGLVCSS